jgi:hypothetical protein
MPSAVHNPNQMKGLVRIGFLESQDFQRKFIAAYTDMLHFPVR